ncbi:hypothetical protein Pryu01_01210 [Paraliobacillus ryukyuensis]|uniref:Uncharacterized protein DUF4935 n=1 Tax=Paraliobacillus ryukyuensis TaxID=200904 RepID=A0A366DSB1_9BACI|nr:PIN domain-containing protein [Paraliobacillus ryukyuensis]RBO92098.1 uncharacterized protein DUF4935 [Paraliobacillus ryukyuensis]
MNIFLDTTVIFSDPLFKGNYNSTLLKLAEEYRDITFYMSNIVYKEAERYFEMNVRKSLIELKKAKKNLQKYKYGIFETLDTNYQSEEEVSDIVGNFKSFYSGLEDKGLLKILPSPNNILSDLIHRSVNRIKPFKENKSEFRDAATWLTYVNYVEENKIMDCYLITENVADFFDEQKKNIHPDLIKDTKKFKAFLNLKKLATEDVKINNYIEEKQGKKQYLQKWIDYQGIDEDFVLGYFESQILFNELFYQCTDYISSLNNIKDEYRIYGGQPLLNNIDIKRIQDFNIDIIAEQIVISGDIIIEADCYVKEFFKDENGINFETIPFITGLIQPFSFTLDTETKGAINLQLEDIFTYSQPRVDPTIYF